MSISEKFSELLGFKSNAQNTLPKSSSKNARDNLGGDGFLSSPMMKAWTAPRIDQIRAYKHWVYVAINRIADKIASQAPNIGMISSVEKAKIKIGNDPEKLFELKKNCQFLEYYRTKALTPLFGQETIEHVKHNHPLRKVLSDPNEPDTSYDLWYETVMFLLLTGSAYWWVPKNKVTGVPLAIWVIPSHWVWPIAGKTNLIEYYEVRPVEGNYLRRAFPADEIIRFVKKSPISKIDGYSPMVAGDHWIDEATSIERSRNANFKNGAFPSVALEFDGSYLDPGEEDLRRIESKFLARYSGEINNGKPLLLPPGVKMHNLSVNPREMDYCESSDQVRDNVLALYGVPHVIAGIMKDQTDIVAAHSIFCSVAINPLCRFLGQVLTEKLAKPIDDELRIWWDDMTPEDPTNLEKKLETDLKTGAATPNEIRILRGRTPYLYGGDNPILPNLGIVLPYGDGNMENYLDTNVTTSDNKDEKKEK